MEFCIPQQQKLLILVENRPYKIQLNLKNDTIVIFININKHVIEENVFSDKLYFTFLVFLLL